jgi:DNA polymerase
MGLSWADLNAQILACERCSLAKGIRNKVPGQGDPHARLMLIGEGPGAEEDLQGLAFVGAAGQLLTRMLAAINLTREEVFIANTVKCRPPGNRIPLPEEIAACLPYLREQVRLIRPQVILLLGATALKTVLGTEKRITACRGQWVESKGVHITSTYHPAALLRDPGKKKDAWADLQAVRDRLAALKTSDHPVGAN